MTTSRTQKTASDHSISWHSPYVSLAAINKAPMATRIHPTALLTNWDKAS
jgi:hypothetical protein